MRWGLLVLALAAACARTPAAPTAIAAPEDHIIIPHAIHAKNDVKCIACHESVYDETALGTAKDAFPDEDTCLQCHGEQKKKGNCGMCHTDVAHARKRVPAPGAVRMSHAKHIELVKEDCSRCHKNLPNPFMTADTVPRMADCLACHGHSEAYARAECTGCHPTLASLPLKPLSDFSHQGNYVARHALDARSSAEYCAQCHDPTFCADCHAKTVSTRIELKYPEDVERDFIHRADFLGRHSLEAAADPTRCRRCHGGSFCEDCHRAQNLTPTADNPRNPHPPGWTIPGSPSFHGEEARRDIASCASCHDQGPQSNCVSCHRVGGIGGNPHPASWLSHHDHSEISKNGMCAACHV